MRTGDVCKITPDGYIRITDRAKDVIKSGGEWISSIELENTLMAHPAVAEAAVVGVKHEKWQERPIALAVLAPDAESPPRRSCSRSWASGWPSGGCPTGWCSSTPSPRPVPASSTRRWCATSTPTP